MSYKKASFYFMSGTGNSYRVAAWLKNVLKEAGILSTVQSIGSKANEVPHGNMNLTLSLPI